MGVASLLGACGGTRTDGVSSPSYTLGGTLSGLADGQTLDLTNGSETLTRSANGTFTFVTPVAQGGSYEVKVSGAQPAWQTCSASSAVGSAVSANVTTVVVSCVSADMAATGQLNDTGINWCSENITTPNTWVNKAVCSAINWGANLWGQQQDAFFGRDAQAKAGTLQKVGAGIAGFDFTKIGASGRVLVKQGETWSDTGSEAAGTMWDCVRDNVTGLVWEVKRNDPTHLRHMGHTYAWYKPDATNNGGAAGVENPLFDTNGNAVTGPTCTGVADTNKCNTQSYVAAVNAAGLCGKKDWRMPTHDELTSQSYLDGSSPAIDRDFFPNTTLNWVWSSSPSANQSDSAWFFSFDVGDDFIVLKNNALGVRVVRSGQ